MVRIRGEEIGDLESIRQVNLAAFGQPNEADLVDALRGVADPFISLIAEDDGEIVGHLCLTPVVVERNEAEPLVILGLAPMAVAPSRQNQGIGTQLVNAALEAARNAGFRAVVVLGHPDYYPRFGFEPAAPKGLTSEYGVPAPVFMVAELVEGAAAELQGVARYHPVFANFA